MQRHRKVMLFGRSTDVFGRSTGILIRCKALLLRWHQEMMCRYFNWKCCTVLFGRSSGGLIRCKSRYSGQQYWLRWWHHKMPRIKVLLLRTKKLMQRFKKFLRRIKKSMQPFKEFLLRFKKLMQRFKEMMQNRIVLCHRRNNFKEMLSGRPVNFSGGMETGEVELSSDYADDRR